ncbi:MAG TPA: tol-pal system protein YbgF [Gemmatimonadaceae bacterium]|nr:tol-pal system protein YbgF [Gemmatimonadaceae bacterium]
MMQAAGLRFAKSAAAAVLVVSSAGCFASTAQLDEVRDDVSTARAESATADSVRAVQLVQILSTLRDLEDSIGALNQRMTRLRAETQADLRGMRQTVSQIAEVSGQSEARLKELRSQIDSRIKQVPSSPAPASTPADTLAPAPQTTTAPQTVSPPPAEEGPDAEELYRIGRDQLTRGGNSAARAALADLLKRFPDSELAPDAQFLMGEAYSAERNVAAADSAYSIVVTKYPDSPRAPTALYKRGVLAQGARRTTTARRLYNELIQKYPSSDEAELARERLRVMG